MSRRWTRRATLRAIVLAGGAGVGAAILAGCGEAQIIEVIKEVPVEKIQVVTKEVAVEKIVEKIVTVEAAAPKAKSAKLSFWMQEWADGVSAMQGAIDAFEGKNPNYTIELVPIGYEDLLAKFYPAITSQTSGEIVYSYTNWWLPIDVTKVLHALTPDLRSKAELNGIFFPTTLDSVWSKDGERYVVPLINGINHPIVTADMKAAADSGVDLGKYLDKSFETWETFAETDQKLRVMKDGKLVRSGLYMETWSPGMWAPSMARQLGAEYYDTAKDEFNWLQPEVRTAFEFVAKYYAEAVSRDVQTDAWPALVKQRGVMDCNGLWTVSYYGGIAPELAVEPFPLPNFPGTTVNTFDTSHTGSLTVPKFVKDEKKDAAFDFMVHIWQPESLAAFGNFYSGAQTVQAVYRDPAYLASKWGKFSAKWVPSHIWPYVKYTQHHVASIEGEHVGKVIDEIAFDKLDLDAGLERLQKDTNQVNSEALARLRAG